MKLGIDITPTQDQFKNRGIGRVAFEITQRLISNQDKNHGIVLFGFKENFPDFNGKYKVHTFQTKVLKSKPYNPFYWKVSFQQQVIDQNLDAYLSFNFERGLPIGHTKNVIFIHDIIPFMTGNFSSTSFLHNIIKRKFYGYALEQARKADLVLTNSKFTREEIIKYAGFDREKIKLTYLGVDDRFKEEYSAEGIQKALNRYGLKFPYVLYYGGFETNKNIINLLRAWDKFLAKNPLAETKLVISGRKKSFERFLYNNSIDMDSFIHIKEKDGLYLSGHIGDSHLPMILKGASLFIHLSSYEGFGLALAEAITMKRPIIGSKIPVYEELVKNHDLLVDSHDPDAISELINKQLIDRKRSSLNVDISWNKIAERVIKHIETA